MRAERTRRIHKIACAVVAFFLIFAVIVNMIKAMYSFSEVKSYEVMCTEAQKIKSDINNELADGVKSLELIAEAIAENGNAVENRTYLFDLFDETGIFASAEILLPGDMLLTEEGLVNVSGVMSFEEEVQKGNCISTRAHDAIDPNLEVIKKAIPVTGKNGAVTAVVYGTVSPLRIIEKYKIQSRIASNYFIILEGKTGNYIVDSRHKILGNITVLSDAKFMRGMSYDSVLDDLTAGRAGYTAFKPSGGDDELYAHYEPLDVEDWQIIMLQDRAGMYSGIDSVGSVVFVALGIILLIVLAYVISIYIEERLDLKTNECAQKIRRGFFGPESHDDKVNNVLRTIAEFTKSRSAFMVDMYNEHYSYIMRSETEESITGKEREYLCNELLIYTAMHRKDPGEVLYFSEVEPGSKLETEMPYFNEFLKRNRIKGIYYSVIINNDGDSCIVGIINSRKRSAAELLKSTAACCAMAMYNGKQLEEAESMAQTDSLTGVKNRTAYNRDIDSGNIPTNGVVIYIDVNELHYYNDSHGHTAGDQMLVYIAECLKKAYSENSVYRMGGDEFLIFSERENLDEVKSKMSVINMKINEMKYYISVGLAEYGDEQPLEKAIKCAELMMYEEKANYYQNKHAKQSITLERGRLNISTTGIKEFDAYISAASIRYLGVYCVNHKKDTADSIIVPSYFIDIYNENNQFSKAMRKYISEVTRPEYSRMLSSYLDYNILEKQLKNSVMISAAYVKVNGENVILRIYPVSDVEGIDSVWIFEKAEN